MDYENVYYVDPSTIANATAVVDRRDPRRFGGGRFFGPQPAAQPATIAVTPAATQPIYQYPPMFPPGFSPAFGGFGGGWGGAPNAWPNGWGGWMNPPYQYPPTNNLTSILGGFGDLGSLANIAAQVFAAFLPLPASPTPQDGTDGSDPATNAQVNSSNLIRYQQALATFARRDQQILTIGSVLKELFRRPSSFGG